MSALVYSARWSAGLGSGGASLPAACPGSETSPWRDRTPRARLNRFRSHPSWDRTFSSSALPRFFSTAI